MAIPTDAARETSEYGFLDFRFPELRFPYTGISNTLAAARDSFLEELEEILAGDPAKPKPFLFHGNGRTEQDVESGNQEYDTDE